ncbi:MAG TPA: hypothetical protein VFS64_06675 [Solirubrobacterales bacterium]|nr:hypothetical protein [Solirubrobacterales bacterium]
MLWTLLGLAVIVVVLAGAGLLFVLAVRAGSAFGAAVIAAAATVSAAWLVRFFERGRVMEAVRREELSSIYNQMAQVLHGQEVPPKKRLKLVDEFLKKSLVYASPATLKAYRSWFTQLPKHEKWSKEEFRPSALRYEVFVKAMRKDLGISNWGLQDGDLARMRIHDFDDFP